MVLGFMNKAVYNIFQLLKNLVKLDVIINRQITSCCHIAKSRDVDPLTLLT